MTILGRDKQENPSTQTKPFRYLTSRLFLLLFRLLLGLFLLRLLFLLVLILLLVRFLLLLQLLLLQHFLHYFLLLNQESAYYPKAIITQYQQSSENHIRTYR